MDGGGRSGARARQDISARHRAEMELREAYAELARSQTLLAEQATRDELTGCFNRRAFNGLHSDEVARSIRHDHATTLLLIDLDHFKSVNDRLGHRAGDKVLAEAGRRISERVRKTDRVARYGGEEFAVILPETTAADATLLAEQLKECLSSEAIVVRSHDGGRGRRYHGEHRDRRALGRLPRRHFARQRGGRGALPREGRRS